MDVMQLGNTTRFEKSDLSKKSTSRTDNSNSFMDVLKLSSSKDIKNVDNKTNAVLEQKNPILKKNVKKNDINKGISKKGVNFNSQKKVSSSKKRCDNITEGLVSSNDLRKSINSFTKDIKEELKDILDVDDEKLDMILQQVGVEPIQLVDPYIAREVVLVANDSNTLSDVMVDEQLANDVSDIMDYFASGAIEDTFSIPKDELISLVDEAKSRLESKENNDTNEKSFYAYVNASNQTDVISDEKNVTQAMLDDNVLDSDIDNRIIIDDTKNQNSNDKIKSESNDLSNELLSQMTTVNEEIASFNDISNLKDSYKKETKSKDNFNNNKEMIVSSDASNSELLNAKQVDVNSNNIAENTDNNRINNNDSSVEIEVINEKSTSESTKKDSLKDLNSLNNANDSFDQFMGKLESNIDALGEGTKLEEEVVYVKQLRDIVSQVTNKVKLVIGDKTSNLEMNLNPKHLGKMTLNISEKQGVLTAKIRVENAVAKEALESGLQSLKDSFEQKGMKVNAIEISIANTGVDGHGENNSNFFGNNNEHAMNKKRHKKLKLDFDDYDDIGIDNNMDNSSNDKNQMSIDGVVEQSGNINYTV